MRILDEQLEKAKEKGAEIISAEDVFKLVKELYDLKSTGEFMQECYEKQQLVRQRAALLYTEKNVDGRRESVPKNMVFNLIIIVMVIIIAIMIYYCIAWYKHLG